jgi:hypothetical protein
VAFAGRLLEIGAALCFAVYIWPRVRAFGFAASAEH